MEDSKKVMFGFRASPANAKKLLLKVVASGLSVSQYCEKVICDEEVEIKQVSAELVELVRAKIYFVNKAGNNLNQIARHLHEMRLAGKSDSDKLDYCEHELQRLREDLEYCVRD